MRLLTKSAVSIFIEMLKSESWDNIINHTEIVKGLIYFQTLCLIFSYAVCN